MMTAPTLLLAPILAVLGQAPPLDRGPALYRVGAGDVLEVTVPGRDELSRTPTVQTSGAVWLPLVGEVPVAGLTANEIEGALGRLLTTKTSGGPAVQVKVREYQNQFAWVGGEVNHPGRKALRGATRLVDALVEAGGFTPGASGEVLVTRLEGTFADGSNTLRARFEREAGPGAQEQSALDTVLRNGDRISAATQAYVTVEGEVARPGRYAIEDQSTVSGVLTTAGGLRRSGRSKVSVRRVDPRTGTAQMLEVDLKAVQEGKEPDLRLLPNDAVSVKPRRSL